MRLLLGLAMLLIATTQSALAEGVRSYLEELRTEAVALCTSRWPSHPARHLDCMKQMQDGYMYYGDALKRAVGDESYLVDICERRSRSENPDYGTDWAKTKACLVEWEDMRARMGGNPFFRVFEDSAIRSAKTTRLMADLAFIQQYVRSLALKERDGSYSAVTSGMGAEMLDRWAGDGNFRHAFGGQIGLAPYDAGDGPGSGFLVQFQDVPGYACARVTTRDLGRGVVLTAINDIVMAAPYSRAYFDEEAAKSACSEDGNRVSWVFR